MYTFTLKRFDVLLACFTTSEQTLQRDVPAASGNLVKCSHTALLGLFSEVVEVHGTVAAEGAASPPVAISKQSRFSGLRTRTKHAGGT